MSKMKSLTQLRRWIHMGRIVPDIDPSLTDETINYRKLKSYRNIGMVYLPAKLQTIVEAKLREYSDQSFREEVKYLTNIMHNIKLPDDKDSLKIKRLDIKTELEMREKKDPQAEYDPTTFTLKEDRLKAESELHKLIQGTLEDRRRDWHYYEYDERASLMYLATRLPANYACLKTVMNEIKDFNPDFVPRTVLDFGSGMGSTIWAVSETWNNCVSEFMNIEISKEQQYLCEYLLRDGKHFGESVPGVFHRQYLPSSTKSKYDIVVAAFSMLELPTRDMRANVIENLWNKTNEFLVLIERGNRGGFATINEARHFILDMAGHDVTKRINMTTETRPIFKQTIPQAHVFAPCPHEFACPRATMTKKKFFDICAFKVHFEPLEFGEKRQAIIREYFSYVVLRKGPHPSYLSDDCPIRAARIVEKRKRSAAQVTHKLCCPNGNLSETTITKKKYGAPTYNLAKISNWGDLLPIRVKDTYAPKNSRLLKGEK